MARIKVVMPQMGESITTGTITKWNKAPGDTIDIDETLLEISTDKVESEIPSPTDGRIEVLHFNEGDTVDVGVLIAEIEDDPANVAFGGGDSGSSEAPAPEAKKEETPAQAESAPAASSSSSGSGERRFYTPLVKAMAKDAGIPLDELANIDGSGAGGRVNKSDLEAYMKNRGSAPAASKSSSAPAASSNQGTSLSLPKVNAMAGYSGRVEEVPMDNMRKKIAENMVASKLTSPHVNSISEVDLTHLVVFREKVKNDFLKEEGFKLTYTPFIIYALIQALKDHPLVNSSVDGDKILVKKEINIGCAVAVPGNGLLVPVIKSADNLNLLGICRQINDLADRARNKKLGVDDLQGGTFTFTNVGSFGTLMATPVILQPQVGIYASGVIQKRPVVVSGPLGDTIAVRHMMYGTHTYDHRIIDGELGGKFLESVHQHLRSMDPSSLF